MANILGRSDFNVGQDVSVTIQSSTGQSWTADQLGHMIDVELDREANVAKVPAITRGGKTPMMPIPKGYKGKLSFARINGALEKALIQADQLWFNQGIATFFTIQLQLRNRDTSVDTYLVKDACVPSGKLIHAKQDQHIDQDFPFESPEVVVT